jgi:5'-3' exonuclease
MGIPWYFYNIYNKYNTEKDLTIDEQLIANLNIDDLFLDYNSLIHPCSQQEINKINLLNETTITEPNIEENIILNCLNYTRYIISVIKPKKLYIMIDGVAPRAKINQQRERRFKSHFFKKIISENSHEMTNTNNNTDTNNNTNNKIYWNSNKITPGTLFMDNLIKSLETFKNQMENENLEIIISDSNICGEGEHKMMKIISNNYDKKSNKKICIYGLDADLIMLSLINESSNNIILLRDNTFNTKLNESKRIYTYLNICKLKTYICKDLRSGNINLNENQISDLNLIYDYIFLCFLMGNDFLEHIPSLFIKEGGINVILKCYNFVIDKYKSPIINLNRLNNNDWKSCINLDMLKDIFYNLSKSESYFFTNIYSAYKTNNKSNKSIYKDIYDLNSINTTENLNVYFYTEDKIKYNEIGYKSRYYKYYNIDNIDSACEAYLTGLYWILGYYNNHNHNNWSWYYPYHEVPFASDLHSYLCKNKTKFLENINYCESLQSSSCISSLEQLFLVLPKESLLEIIKEKNIIIYNKLLRMFNTESKLLDNYYPNKIYLDITNKEYLWQSKIFLKNINTNILIIL